ncbi:hypothetical protein ACF5W4_11095 [Bacillota bacterium Lsc_1132]
MAREFTMGARITLADNFTDPMASVRRATQAFNDAARQADGSISQMGQAANRAAGDMRQFSNDMDQLARAENNARNNAGGLRGMVESLRSSFTGLHGIILAVAGAEITKGAYNWLINSNAQMEQYQNTLTVVLGSQKKAVETLNWAAKFAAQTPFEIPQIVEATTRMSAYGMQAKDTLGVIGDMASVMGTDLMQAVEAVADAQTGELERLKEFGITKKMIEDQASSMKLQPFDSKGSLVDQSALNTALFAIMEKRFKGGMEMQSKTFKGMLSNVADFVGTAGRELGKPIFDKAKAGLQNFLTVLNGLSNNGALDRFIANTNKFGSQIGAVFSKIGQIIGPILGKVFGDLWQIASPVLIGMQMAMPYITAGFKAAGDAAQFVSDVIVKNWNLIGPIIQGVAIAWATYGVVMLSVKTWTLATAAATKIQTAALFVYRAAILATNIVMMVLRGQFVALWFTMLASPIGLVVTALGLLVGAGILVYKNFDKVKAAFGAAWDYMAPKIKPVTNAVVAFAQTSGAWIVQEFGKAKQAVAGAASWIGNAFNGAGSKISAALTALGPVGDFIKNSFSTVGNTIATLLPLITKIGMAFLGISGPVGWAILAVVSMGSTIYKVMQGNSAAKDSILAAWNSLVAGIQPLLAAFGQIGQTFVSMLGPAIQQFVAAFQTLAPQFQQTGAIIMQSIVALGPSFQQLGVAVGQLLQAYFSLTSQIWGAVIPAVLQLATQVLPLILQAATMVFPAVLTIVQTVLPLVLQLITSLIPVILQIAQTVLPLILQAVTMVFPIILQIITAVIPIVVQIISTIVPIILQIAQIVLPLILQVVQAVFPIILAIIQAAIPIITALLTFAAQIITGILVPAIQIILSIVQVVFPAIMSIIQTALNVVIGIIRTATAILKGDWSGAWNEIKGIASTIMNGIINFFKSIDLVGIGKNIIQGLINGIGSMAKAAVSKAKEIAGNIKDAVTGFFKIHSPSRVFRDDVGQQLGAGLVIGMDRSQDSVARAAENMAAAAMPNLGDVTGPNLSTQLDIATNMAIPTVPDMRATLNVGTQFDNATAPTYAAALASQVNPAGKAKSETKGDRYVTIQKLIEKIDLHADKDTDAEKLLDKLIELLHDKLKGADDILGSANMGALL